MAVDKSRAARGSAGNHRLLANQRQSVERAKKIEMPIKAAKLAVGHGAQPHFHLRSDRALDESIFDRTEFIARKRARLGALARLLQLRRAQEATNMVRMRRQLRSLPYIVSRVISHLFDHAPIRPTFMSLRFHIPI